MVFHPHGSTAETANSGCGMSVHPFVTGTTADMCIEISQLSERPQTLGAGVCLDVVVCINMVTEAVFPCESLATDGAGVTVLLL